jgi:hypothetical protein
MPAPPASGPETGHFNTLCDRNLTIAAPIRKKGLEPRRRRFMLPLPSSHTRRPLTGAGATRDWQAIFVLYRQFFRFYRE